MGLYVGFQLGEIIYIFNCVSIEEIEEVMVLGVWINIDNFLILE